jgi:hypothetical protein
MSNSNLDHPLAQTWLIRGWPVQENMFENRRWPDVDQCLWLSLWCITPGFPGHPAGRKPLICTRTSFDRSMAFMSSNSPNPRPCTERFRRDSLRASRTRLYISGKADSLGKYACMERSIDPRWHRELPLARFETHVGQLARPARYAALCRPGNGRLGIGRNGSPLRPLGACKPSTVRRGRLGTTRRRNYGTSGK